LNFRNLENAKRKAHLIKWRSMENLDKLLPEFEAHAIRNGMKVIWANDDLEAKSELAELLQSHRIQTVTREPSPMMEEVSIDQLLQEKAVQIKHAANEVDEPVIPQVDASICEVNFLIADSGSLVVSQKATHTAGRGFPSVQIYLAGIEDVIPSFRELELFWPLLDQHLPAKNAVDSHSILSGRQIMSPTKDYIPSYLILLDNGRSDLLAKAEQRQGLYCIRCEACLDVCPIYQHIGPEGYDSVRPGPIGSLITPHTKGMKEFKHLSEKSTLCGKCTAVCPVNIDVSRMLLLNRRDAVQEGLAPLSEKITWQGYTRIMSQRKWLDFFGPRFKNFIYRLFYQKNRINKSDAPLFKKRSFSQHMKGK